jgi:hypothetical protein
MKSHVNVGPSPTCTSPDDKWLAGAFVRKLTDATIYTGGGGAQSALINGCQTNAIARARTYGARVRLRA